MLQKLAQICSLNSIMFYCYSRSRRVASYVVPHAKAKIISICPAHFLAE